MNIILFNCQMSLKERIKKIILNKGPLPVDEYINLCLYDKKEGYYNTQQVIGKSGDFVTAPETSQIFGELIALFIINQWQNHKKKPLQIIECGPGRGTLMKDMLRVFQKFEGFMDDFSIHFLECSPLLKKHQQDNFKDDSYVFWHESFESIPINDGFTFIIANEFFDALPIKQYAERNGKKQERNIILSEGNELIFDEHQGITESHESYKNIIQQVNQRIDTSFFLGLLIIDYGYGDDTLKGETLQGIKNHAFSSILENPGCVDISHHVNFNVISRLLSSSFKQYELLTQKEFLEMLGIEERMNHLLKQASPSQRIDLLTACARLISPQHMGNLFKVLYACSHD